MKKIITLLLTVLFILSLAACSSEKKEESTDSKAEKTNTVEETTDNVTDENDIVTPSTVNNDNDEADTPAADDDWEVSLIEKGSRIPKEIVLAFEDALGSDIRPVIYLRGNMDESGTHVLLCQDTSQSEPKFKVYVVKNPSKDDLVIEKQFDFRISDYAEGEGSMSDSDLAIPDEDDIGSDHLPKPYDKAFDSALSDSGNTDLEPVCLLGTRGNDCAVLCYNTADPNNYLQVVITEASSEKSVTIKNICTVDTAAFAK